MARACFRFLLYEIPHLHFAGVYGVLGLAWLGIYAASFLRNNLGYFCHVMKAARISLFSIILLWRNAVADVRLRDE
jgi:hypothetical protein